MIRSFENKLIIELLNEWMNDKFNEQKTNTKLN